MKSQIINFKEKEEKNATIAKNFVRTKLIICYVKIFSDENF